MTSSTKHGKVQSGKFELGYTVEGTGKPTIVIGSSIYYPRVFSQNLRKHLQLAFIDHRGFAPTSETVDRSDFDLDIVLDDIDRLRKHLGYDDIIILGHSGHGYMALEYAKKYAQHVSHVVIVATGPSHSQHHVESTEKYWQEFADSSRKEQFTKDIQHLSDEIAAAPEKRFITFCLRFGARSWFNHAFDASHLWKDVQVNMTGIDYLWGEVFRDIDITKGLGSLKKPVFLALGKSDHLIAPYFSWEPYREKFYDLTLKVFDKSSHTPQLEESAAFDHTLLSWLRAQNE